MRLRFCQILSKIKLLLHSSLHFYYTKMKNSESSFYFEYYDDIDFETKNEYLSRINCETNKLRFLFNISEPMALKFLFENKLNLEESISSLFKFFENNQTSFFSLKNYQIEEINDTCEICLDVCEKRISNNCEHFFCEKCYANFIEIFLETNGFEAIFAKCPEPSCEVNIKKIIKFYLYTFLRKYFILI